VRLVHCLDSWTLRVEFKGFVSHRPSVIGIRCSGERGTPAPFQELLDMVLNEFGPKVVSVTLYGSRISGGARTRSDYDMIIIMDQLPTDPNMREEFVASAITRILLSSGARISPLVLSKKEATAEAENGSPLLATVLANYKILYDPTGFMVLLLDLTKQFRPSLTFVERGKAWNLSRTV